MKLRRLLAKGLKRPRRSAGSKARLRRKAGLAQTQTPDATIQAISGHLSQKMLEHYSHVRLEAKRRAVETLDSLRVVQ